MPFLGELVIGLTRFEVCSDAKQYEPDFIGFDFRLNSWQQVALESQDVWESIKDAELYRVEGNPSRQSKAALLRMGIPPAEVERLCEYGDAPTLLPRGLTHLIDGV